MTHEVCNEDRAGWAEGAIQKFIELTGTDREDALADLLCDLLHWADREYFVPTDPSGFDCELARARMHFEAEVAEELEEAA